MDPSKRPGSVALLVGLVLLVTTAGLAFACVPMVECPRVAEINEAAAEKSRMPGAYTVYIEEERKYSQYVHNLGRVCFPNGEAITLCNRCGGLKRVTVFSKLLSDRGRHE